MDQISGQIQALNDTMDELKVRLAKLSKQLEDMQSAQQSLAANQAQQQQQAQAMAQAPPPDVLYNNALRDYNGGKPDLATQELNDYIKFYPNTDLAGNAYFYLAELQYRAANSAKAIEEYDLVLQNFPSGNKAAAAQLKKGFALLETGKRRRGYAGIETRDPALSQDERGHASAGEIKKSGPAQDQVRPGRIKLGSARQLQRYFACTHSESSFGGRTSVCMTTQYCSVLSRSRFNCSAEALGARTSKRS